LRFVRDKEHVFLERMRNCPRTSSMAEKSRVIRWCVRSSA
jgi:hypothetical protein